MRWMQVQDGWMSYGGSIQLKVVKKRSLYRLSEWISEPDTDIHPPKGEWSRVGEFLSLTEARNEGERLETHR